jgi:hypothetical protein
MILALRTALGFSLSCSLHQSLFSQRRDCAAYLEGSISTASVCYLCCHVGLFGGFQVERRGIVGVVAGPVWSFRVVN